MVKILLITLDYDLTSGHKSIQMNITAADSALLQMYFF